jgi:hypothetical protein
VYHTRVVVRMDSLCQVRHRDVDLVVIDGIPAIVTSLAALRAKGGAGLLSNVTALRCLDVGTRKYESLHA